MANINDSKDARITEVYNYIVKYFEDNMRSPTYQDICEGVNLASTASVSTYINRLEALGLIKLNHGRIGLNGYALQPTKDSSFYKTV